MDETIANSNILPITDTKGDNLEGNKANTEALHTNSSVSTLDLTPA